MALKSNQMDSFSKEISEFEHQVFQTLKWTFFFLTPLFSLAKNVFRLFIEYFTNLFRNNHLS